MQTIKKICVAEESFFEVKTMDKTIEYVKTEKEVAVKIKKAQGCL